MSILKAVQSYIIQTKNKTIGEYLAEKHRGFEQGWRIDGDLVVFYFSPTVKLADNPLSSPAEYKWRVEGNRITPVSGRAAELTPELLN